MSFDPVALKPTGPSGLLALAYVGKSLPLQVLRSAAGHYIGTFDRPRIV
jgi:hypothetical protein